MTVQKKKTFHFHDTFCHTVGVVVFHPKWRPTGDFRNARLMAQYLQLMNKSSSGTRDLK